LVGVLCERVLAEETPLGVDSLTLRYWLVAKLQKQGLWTGERRERNPSRMQRKDDDWRDKSNGSPGTDPPLSLPVSTRSIYDTIQRKGLWAASDHESAKRAQRSFHAQRKAQPTVGGYGFRAYVFCNAELRRILSQWEDIRRVPAFYLIHLPGTWVPLDGEAIPTVDW